MNKKYLVWGIALLGTFFAFFWQEINLQAVNSLHNENWQTIPTADDASYLAPAINFYNDGVWADNSEGITRYFQRPPGYGMIYLGLYSLLGNHATIGLKILQLLGFFFSIVLFYKLLHHLKLQEKLVWLFTLLFAVLPIYSGFVYYTLTEGITPFLLLWTIYGFFRKNNYSLFFATLLLLLVRVQLVVFPLAFLLISLFQCDKRRTLVLLACFLPISFWVLRTTIIAKEWMGIHPIYSETNTSLFRPGHQALTELFKIWEYDGMRFHTVIRATYEAESKTDIEEVLTNIPNNFRAETFPLLVRFQHLYQRSDYGESEDFLMAERAFVEDVKMLRIKLIKQYPIDYFLFTPIKSTKYLLTKSQLNLSIFQESFRGKWGVEMLRIGCVLLINLGFLACLALFFLRTGLNLKIIAATCLIYLFYLCFFQRMNEERYLTPLLPILLINIAIVTENIQLYQKKMEIKLFKNERE